MNIQRQADAERIKLAIHEERAMYEEIDTHLYDGWDYDLDLSVDIEAVERLEREFANWNRQHRNRVIGEWLALVGVLVVGFFIGKKVR